MGSKTKTSKSNNNRTSGYQGVIGPQKEILAPLGMGPGQSMAMAGNTGLASATPAQARQIQQGLQNLGQPSSFQAIGQNIGEVGSKYRRPADVASYAEKMQQLNRALDAGGNIFTGPDEIERVNLAGTGIKDEQGRTILSMMTPELTATAPTMGQLGGDIGRAFTGYDSLQYTDPTSNVPQMVRTKGLADVLARAAIPGSMALNIIQDLYGKGKNFFFPEEEEEDTFSSAADAMGGAAAMSLGDIRTQKNLAGTTADEIDQFIRTIGQPNVDPFSSGADATRPVNTTDRYSSAADAMGGAGVDLEKLERANELLKEMETYEPKPNIFGLTDEGTYEVGPNLIGVGPEMGIFNDPFDRSSGYTPGLQKYYENLIAQGVSPEEAERMTLNLSAYGYKDGGLTTTVPPKEGPMSAGVASLFKNK